MEEGAIKMLSPLASVRICERLASLAAPALHLASLTSGQRLVHQACAVSTVVAAYVQLPMLVDGQVGQETSSGAMRAVIE